MEEAAPNPERVKREALVSCCVKRRDRAEDKLATAEREMLAASHATVEAHADLDAWITANPDPQLSLI